MDRIKPLDTDLLNEISVKFSKIVVVEDNFNSGLFNSICQWSVENKFKNEICSISPMEAYDTVIGDADYLENIHGLSEEKLQAKLKVLFMD